jgi:hypothetical protein
MVYADIIIAERFGALPWEIEEAPADRVAYYLGILGIEGEYKGLMDGLEPNEAFIEVDYDDDQRH